MLLRLAGWMRQRGRERRQEIWLRDAALAERLDGVLFIGLKDWYPPIYDCGACGYATCAEFIEATSRSWHCAVPEREHDQQVSRRDDRGAARHEASR